MEERMVATTSVISSAVIAVALAFGAWTKSADAKDCYAPDARAGTRLLARRRNRRRQDHLARRPDRIAKLQFRGPDPRNLRCAGQDHQGGGRQRIEGHGHHDRVY